jgi:non-specific serine/threonine protein kinase/serine/threonine-protein kinase
MKTEFIDDAKRVTSEWETLSAMREGSPAKLRRRLSGDLDTIVLHAMRKEPQRRYVSVEQFAEDIRHHLQGLPVTARPDSWRYRTGKFVIRQKVGMAAAALIVLAIATGMAATLREARIAAASQRRAEKRFNDVRSLANSLMFEIHSSVEGLPGAAGARQLIVQKSQEYLDSLAQESAGDISLQRELASAYNRLGTLQGGMYESSLGDANAATKSLQKAVSIRTAIANSDPHNGDDQTALARAYEQLGRAQWLSSGGSREGLQNLKSAVAIAEAQARENPQNANVLEVLAQGYQYLGDLEGGSGLRGGTADLSDAIVNHRKALPLLQEIADAAPSDPNKKYLLARALLGVGDDCLRAAAAVKALDYYQQANTIVEPLARSGNNALYTRGLAICQTRIGDALLMSGLAGEALTHYRNEERVLRPLAATDPHDTVAQLTLVTSEGDIAHALVESGRVAEGTANLQHALAETVRVTRTANDSYARTLLASTNALMGEALERGGNASSARLYYSRALDLYGAAASADPADLEDAVNVIIMRNHLAHAELTSRAAKAASEQYSAAAKSAEALSASSPGNVEVLYALADTYSGLGDVSVAQAKSTAGLANKTKTWHEAASWYDKSLTTWKRVPRPGPVSPNGFAAGDPRKVARLAKQTEEMAGGAIGAATQPSRPQK